MLKLRICILGAIYRFLPLKNGSTRSYKMNKEVFVKQGKAQTAPDSKGGLTISYMLMFWKITTFGHFSQFYPMQGFS